MSVLVKGMEMPENCRDCEFWCMYRNSHRMYCKSINRQLEADEENAIEKKRLSDCPLIEVPVPHGRLIDAETKIEAQYYDEEYEEWTMQTFTVEDIISIADNEVPTVIESEVME